MCIKSAARTERYGAENENEGGKETSAARVHRDVSVVKLMIGLATELRDYRAKKRKKEEESGRVVSRLFRDYYVLLREFGARPTIRAQHRR